MATRESFIPLPRHILIDSFLDSWAPETDSAEFFKEFCDCLSLFYHLKYHRHYEQLKAQFLPFDPEETDLFIDDPQDPSSFIQQCSELLASANFFPLSKETLQASFAAESLIALKTEVDFDDFVEVVCYGQGDIFQEIKEKKFFREKTQQIDIYERVVLLVQFKSEAYFRAKKIDVDQLSFKPGKIYLSLYKNIPKKDVEFIFPNVKVSMLLRDKLLFWVPAIAGGVPTVLKIIPQLTLIVSIILFVVFSYLQIDLDFIQIQSEELEDVMPVLVAMLSIVLGCGGFAMRQLSNYKFKSVKFQKEVTDTLFFRNMANNFGVVQLLIDAAEEEECKEILLVYFFLLQQSQPANAATLDQQIEAWFLEKWKMSVDFDIKNTLAVMESLGGDRPLVHKTEEGFYQAIPLAESKTLLQNLLQQSFA